MREPGRISAGLLVLNGASTLRAAHVETLRLLELEHASGALLPWHSLVGALNGAGVDVQPLTAPRGWWREFDSADHIAQFGRTAVFAAAEPVLPAE